MLGGVVPVAVVDVRLVEVVVLVHVDVDVVVAPTDVAPDRGADDHARGEGKSGAVGIAWRVVGAGGRISVPPRPVHGRRIVGRQ
jgi:hypothetical protein